MVYRRFSYGIVVKISDSSRNLFNASIFSRTKYLCGLVGSCYATGVTCSSWVYCRWTEAAGPEILVRSTELFGLNAEVSGPTGLCILWVRIMLGRHDLAGRHHGGPDDLLE